MTNRMDPLTAHFYAIQSHTMLRVRSILNSQPSLADLDESHGKNTSSRDLSIHALSIALARLRLHPSYPVDALPALRKGMDRIIPIQAHDTHIPKKLFRAWLRFYCQTSSRHPDETTCPRPGSE